MNAFASYRALNTKLQSRQKTFLKGKEWEQMLGFKSVTEVIDFLRKRQGYHEIIDLQDTKEMHRTELEVNLNYFMVLELERMMHYFSGSYKSFFEVMFMRYEIEDLLLILRAIARDELNNDIKNHFVHSEKYSKVPFSELLECKNVTQFVDTLKGTLYYLPLKTLTEEDARSREFHMEMKLNILFYRTLMEKAKKLHKKDYRIVEEIVGFSIDYLNVQWIYRATKYYDISREEILIYSLPCGLKLSYSRLKKLAYTESFDTFRKLVKKYLGEDVFEDETDVYLERHIDVLIYEIISKQKNENTIGLALAYMYRIIIEIKDLIAVVEGIRYGLSQEEIKKYLVYKI